MTEKQQQGQVQQQKIDYQLHKAQQLEILNQSVEMLKNNIYGQTQVDIILYGMATGKSEDEAIEFSTNLINKINTVNLEKMKQRREEIEEKMRMDNNPAEVVETPAEPVAEVQPTV